MKKLLFTFTFIFMFLPLMSNEGPFINVSFIEPNCSNSCLSNFTDIEKCNAGKIILEEIQEIDTENK